MSQNLHLQLLGVKPWCGTRKGTIVHAPMTEMKGQTTMPLRSPGEARRQGSNKGIGIITRTHPTIPKTATRGTTIISPKTIATTKTATTTTAATTTATPKRPKRKNKGKYSL